MATAIEVPPKVPIFGSEYQAAGGLPPVGEYLGKIIDPPAAWSSDNQMSSGSIINIRKHLPDSPYKYGFIGGRDHAADATGGAHLWVANKLTGPWTYYDSTIAAEFTSAGWSGHPTSNPLAIITGPTDAGEYPTVLFDPATNRFLLFMHSTGFGVGQTTGVFTSTNFLTWTYNAAAHDTLGYAGSIHDGYGTYTWGARGIIGQTVATDVQPITYQLVRSHDALNFCVDHRRLWGRDCAHWGYNTLEFPCNAPVVYFDGKPWRIGGLRDIPASGGVSTNGTLVAAPVSSDYRRWIGPPVVLCPKGGSGTDHELATSDGSDRVFVDDDGTIYALHQIEDSANVRALGLTRISPRSAQRPWSDQPTLAVSTQSGFDGGVGIDHEGYPVPCGRYNQLRTLADLDFAVITSVPSNAQEVSNSGTPTFTYTDAASGRGSLSIAVDSASEDGIYLVGPSLAMANWAEVWLEVDGIRTSLTNNYLMQFGFANSDYSRLWCLDCRGGTTDLGRFNVYTGVSNLTDAGSYALQQDDRRSMSHNLRIGITKRYTRTKTLKVYLELWDGDQIIAKRDITSLHSDTTIRAYIRATRHSSFSNTMSVTAIRVKAGEALTGT